MRTTQALTFCLFPQGCSNPEGDPSGDPPPESRRTNMSLGDTVKHAVEDVFGA